MWQQRKGSATMVCHPFSRFHPILSSHWVGWCSSRMWIIPRPLKTCWIRWHHPNFWVPIRSQNLIESAHVLNNFRAPWTANHPPHPPEHMFSPCHLRSPFTSNLIQSQKAKMMDYLHPISAQPHRLSISYSQNSLWQTRRGGSLDVWKVPGTLQ